MAELLEVLEVLDLPEGLFLLERHFYQHTQQLLEYLDLLLFQGRQYILCLQILPDVQYTHQGLVLQDLL